MWDWKACGTAHLENHQKGPYAQNAILSLVKAMHRQVRTQQWQTCLLSSQICKEDGYRWVKVWGKGCLTSNLSCACWIYWLFFSLCDAGWALPERFPQNCGWTHCAAWCTSCICRPWPRLFCRFLYFRLDTGAGSSVCEFCHWHISTLGSFFCSSTWFHNLLQSSWGALAKGDTHQHTQALSKDLCWYTGHLKCTWWISVPGSQLERDLQNAQNNEHWDS